MDGFQPLATCLATGHAHLPFPDVVQWQVDENLVVCQHLLEYLEPWGETGEKAELDTPPMFRLKSISISHSHPAADMMQDSRCYLT